MKSHTIRLSSQISDITLNSGMSRLLTESYRPDSEDIYSFDSGTITSFDTEPDLNAATQLVPCSICNRTFNPVTLRKHVAICEKMATKKRNVFDSSRQRREGTELAAYIPPKNNNVPATNSQIHTPKSHRLSPTSATANNNKPTRTPPTAPNNFLRGELRTSRYFTKKQTHNSPTEQCPHCERCFGLKAYDRHVEWCKEKALQASIKQNARGEQKLAKERLEARIKYRAPLLKTKRSMNREKYAIVGNIETNLSERTFVCSNINTTRRNTVSTPLTPAATSQMPFQSPKTLNTIQEAGNRVAKGFIKNCFHNNTNKTIGKESQEDRTKTSCRPLDIKKNRNTEGYSIEQEFHIFGGKCNTSTETRKEINNTLINEKDNIKSGIEKVPLKIKSTQGPTMNRITSRKRQQKEQIRPSTPMKAVPLLKETMELFGLTTNKKTTIKDQDFKTSIPTGVGTRVLMRNKSFVLSAVATTPIETDRNILLLELAPRTTTSDRFLYGKHKPQYLSQGD